MLLPCHLAVVGYIGCEVHQLPHALQFLVQVFVADSLSDRLGEWLVGLARCLALIFRSHQLLNSRFFGRGEPVCLGVGQESDEVLLLAVELPEVGAGLDSLLDIVYDVDLDSFEQILQGNAALLNLVFLLLNSGFSVLLLDDVPDLIEDFATRGRVRLHSPLNEIQVLLVEFYHRVPLV